MYTPAYISALTALPPSSSATRAGAHRSPERGGGGLGGRHHVVAQLRDPEHDADHDHRDHDDDEDQGHELLRVDRLDVDAWRERASSATPSSITWATMLPTLMSSPPDATADARSTPCFCRNRICAAMPPDRRHREVGERHRQLQFGGAHQGQVDRHGAHERDRGGEVGEQRDDHRQRSASRCRRW